jgi:hypothetical protein
MSLEKYTRNIKLSIAFAASMLTSFLAEGKKNLPTGDPVPYLVHAVAESGGATYDDNKHQVFEAGKDAGFAVSIMPDNELKVFMRTLDSNVIAKSLIGFMETNKEILSSPENHIGIWYDKENNQLYFDITQVVPTEKGAMDLAKTHKQVAVFNLSTADTIYLNNQESDTVTASPTGTFILLPYFIQQILQDPDLNPLLRKELERWGKR